MRKNKTNIILIVSILLLVITVFVFAYLFNVIKNKNRHGSAVSSTLENKIIEKDNIKDLLKKISELGDVHKKIGDHFVDTARIDTFVEFLEEMGVYNNIELSVKSVEVPKNEKNKLIISVDMRGEFQDVVRVVALLENSPYNLTINSLYLNKEIAPSTDTSMLNTKEKDLQVVAPARSLWEVNTSFSVLSI